MIVVREVLNVVMVKLGPAVTVAIDAAATLELMIRPGIPVRFPANPVLESC